MLVFDGDCGFCTSSAHWIERRLPIDVEVEPWQSLDLEALDLDEADVTAAAWWIEPGRAPVAGHEAIGRSLMAAGGGWAWVGRAIVTPPLSWIAAPIYALVAKNRHRLPGATEACELPR